MTEDTSDHFELRLPDEVVRPPEHDHGQEEDHAQEEHDGADEDLEGVLEDEGGDQTEDG